MEPGPICPGLKVNTDSSSTFEGNAKDELQEDFISDSELPPETLDDDRLEELVPYSQQYEDSLARRSDLYMENFFHGIDNPSALARRNKTVSRDCSLKILQGISHSLDYHPGPFVIPKPFKRNFKKKTLPPEQNKPKLNFWPDQMAKIDECIKSTLESTVKPVRQKISGLVFDYHELQKGIRLQYKIQSFNYVYSKLYESTKDTPPKPDGDKPRLKSNKKWMMKKIAEEFQEIYGPMDVNHPKVKIYLKRYFKWMLEKREELQIKLSDLREVRENYGVEFLRSLLLSQRIGLLSMEDSLKENLAEKKLTYDLNPFTNVSHLDWFILPRPKLTEKNIFIRHPKWKEVLTEFDDHSMGKEKSKSTMIIPGYWLSLLDIGVSKGVPLSTDIINGIDYDDEMPDEDLPEGELERRRTNAFWWNPLLTQMTKDIARFPFGILVSRFFDLVKEHRRIPKKVPLFRGMTLEEASEKLPDLFLIRKLPHYRDGSESKTQVYSTLLFPAYLGGIVPEDLMPTMLKVWRRIIFLVESAPGKCLKKRTVERRYLQYFNTRIVFRDWGFASVDGFVQWCNHHFEKKVKKEGKITEKMGEQKEKFLEFFPFLV